MDQQVFTLINIAVMVVVMWGVALSFIPFFIWLERKGSAIIQDRVGPQRTGILGFRLMGFIQNFADTLKLLMKENITPANVNRLYFLLAPIWSMTLALLPLLVIPLAAPLDWAGRVVRFQAANFNVGILFVLSITSLGVFGIILAGWSSNNKFSLLGGLRSSAQMISYELSMGLALVGLLMAYQDVRVDTIVQAQGRLLTAWGATLPIPNWGIFLQPVGFLLFLVASFAETNRNPFDLAEGESELVAGYHVEYSSVKFALFFMAEYVNMAVAAFILSTLFLGGYQVPFVSTETLKQDPKLTLGLLCGAVALLKGTAGIILYKRGIQQARLYTGVKKAEPFLLAGLCFAVTLAALGFLAYGLMAGLPQEVSGVLTVLLQLLSLSLKVLFFCWLFVWVRWTLPRFRYDQLMKLGWKLMLPLGLLNLLVTGIIILTQKG